MSTTPTVNGNGNKQEATTIFIPYGDIIADEDFNVRKNYEDIEELAESINGIGLEEPLVVRSTKKGYSLNAGFRRYKAIGLLMEREKPSHHTTLIKNKGVECRVKEYESEALAMISNLAENTGKRGLRTYDLAKRFHDLEEVHGMKRKKIADFCSVTQAYISQLVGCYKDLAPEVLEAWENTKNLAHELPLDKLKEWKKEDQETQAKLLDDYLGDGSGIEDPDAPPEEKENSKKGGKTPTKAEIKQQIEKLEEMKKEGKDLPDGLKALKWATGKLKVLK
jgi:ParB/RepB/Spo0J family partition protein